MAFSMQQNFMHHEINQSENFVTGNKVGLKTTDMKEQGVLIQVRQQQGVK